MSNQGTTRQTNAQLANHTNHTANAHLVTTTFKSDANDACWCLESSARSQILHALQLWCTVLGMCSHIADNSKIGKNSSTFNHRKFLCTCSRKTRLLYRCQLHSTHRISVLPQPLSIVNVMFVTSRSLFAENKLNAMCA